MRTVAGNAPHQRPTSSSRRTREGRNSAGKDKTGTAIPPQRKQPGLIPTVPRMLAMNMAGKDETMSIELITWEPKHVWQLADDTDTKTLLDTMSKHARRGRTLTITDSHGDTTILNPARFQGWTIETE